MVANNIEESKKSTTKRRKVNNKKGGSGKRGRGRGRGQNKLINGRKDGSKVYSVNKIICDKEDNMGNVSNNNIIMHLKIKSDEIINNKIINDSLYQYNPNLSTPQPFNNMCNNYCPYETKNPNPDPKIEPKNQFSFKPLPLQKNKQELPTHDPICCSEKKTKLSNGMKKNMIKIMYEFIDSNNKNNWPESTNIHCWWCAHQFKNMPCAIPKYYINNKFYLYGCFCSFNCAASNIIYSGDNSKWEEMSLLNLLYKKIYPSNDNMKKIKLAPPKECLKMFGGTMDIEEFRSNFNNNIELNIIKPPMISIIPTIEENIINLPSSDIELNLQKKPRIYKNTLRKFITSSKN